MDYNTDIQKLFLRMMIEDTESYVRVQNIYNVDNFDRSLKASATFIKDHCDNHRAMPTREQIQATTSLLLEPVPDMTEDHYDWFFTEFEGFSKQKELNRAILDAADLVDQGEYGPIEKLIKDAIQISLTKDIGLDYYENPKARLMKLKDNNGQRSTGWPTLDTRLFGGFNRGELNIFAGPSSSGKSLFMQNISMNWMQQGLHGVFLTLELNQELCSMRLDSMVTGISSKGIMGRLDDVEQKVKMFENRHGGGLRIKYMPAQSNVNDIKAYLTELQIKTGRKIDFIMVDYLDLLMPVSIKVSASDLFVKDKYVSEELRNFAKELDILFVTASQLNRSAVEDTEYNHSHISGGISKINTADNVFGIFTTRSHRERGVYELQLMKTRSSSGVGQKIELGFDTETMRIFDIGETNQDHGDIPPSSTIFDSIKRTSTVEEPVHVKKNTQADALKDMINKLK